MAMRSTKLRLLDRHTTGAVVLALLIGGACATACGNDETVRFDDAESEAGTRDAATASGDELDADARANAPETAADAGPFDAAVGEVSCESSSCAISLTRVLPRDSSLIGQGFCALLHDGTVACWGSNHFGTLGSGPDAGTSSANPQRVVGLSNAVSLNDTCAVDKDGSTWCWGYGPYLQSDTAPVTEEWSAVKLPISGGQVTMSENDACTLVDGGPVCWGRYGVALPPSAVVYTAAGVPPTAVPMPAGTTVRDFVISNNAAFALRDDGTVLSWGGVPGIGRETSISPDPNPYPIDLEKVSKVSVARVNVCAIADGIPYCWGTVPSLPGGYPDGLDLTRALPTPVATPERVVQISNTDDFNNLTIPLPGRWCAVGGSGAVYCWGNNANGQAGDGTTQYATTAIKVLLPAPAVDVEATADTTCALLVNGKVFCWGGNYYGQLGNGKSKVQSDVPVEVLLP